MTNQQTSIRGSIAALCLGLLLVLACQPSAEAPQLIVFNADIHTVDAAQPLARAMAIQDGRIVAVGSDNEVMALADKDTIARDAGGHTVVPGLIDGHAHLGSGLDLVRGVNLYGIASKAEWLRRIEQRSHQLEPGEWLVGGRWDHTLLDPPELPTRQDLDQVVADRPVALVDVDGHALWVNSLALELAEIDVATEDPVGGRIVRNTQSGEPTGIVLEAGSLVTSKIPELSREERLRRRRETLVMAGLLGITTVHEMGTLGALEDYRALQQAEPLPVRVWFGVTVADGSALGADQAQALAGLSREIAANQRQLVLERGDRGPRLSLGYVKRVLDGVLSSRTAALLEPYADAPLELGLPRWTSGELAEQVIEINRAGLPVAIHAIGDLAVRMSLDAFAAAREAVGAVLPANRIEHNEVVDPADAPRYAQLDVLASMNPHHCTSGIGKYNLLRLGEQRAAWSFAWGRLQRAGAELVFGSDWPTAPLDPLQQIYAATVREKLLPDAVGTAESTEESWFPDNRLTFEQALRAYTLAGAAAAGWQQEIGSLTVGKWADFVILDRRLDEPVGRALRQTRVEETFVAGRSVAGRRAFLGEWQPDPLQK